MCVYVDRKGKKYKGRERVCEVCGETKIVRITVKTDICRKCAARNRKSSIPEDIPVKIYLRNGVEKKRRLKKEVCKICGEERFTRADHDCSSGLCNKCRAVELGKKHGPINGASTYRTGIGVYRKKALNIFKQKCICCGEMKKRIIIHHIDEDRTNNDIFNLVPLCHSCHRLIHNKIKHGMPHEEAFKITYGERNGIKEHDCTRI